MIVEKAKDENKTTSDVIKSIPESEIRNVVDSTKFECKVDTLPGVPTAAKFNEYCMSLLGGLASLGGPAIAGLATLITIPVSSITLITSGKGKLMKPEAAAVLKKEDYEYKLYANYREKQLTLKDEKGNEHTLKIAMTRTNKIITGVLVPKKVFDKKFICMTIFRLLSNTLLGKGLVSAASKFVNASKTVGEFAARSVGAAGTVFYSAALGSITIDTINRFMPWMNSWIQDEDFMVFKLIRDNKQKIGAEYMLLSTDMRMYKMILKEHKKGSFTDIQMAVSDDKKYVLIKL